MSGADPVAFNRDEDYPGHERRIRDWLSARPGSDAARFALAVHGYSWAWHARGTGFSNQVSQEAWMLFGKRIEPALENVYGMVKSEVRCAAPYQLALHMLNSAGAPRAVLEQVYEAGASRYPGFHEVHMAMARNYEPRWGGSVEAYHGFVDRVVERTRSIEGTAMYARLFSNVDFGDMKFEPGRPGAPDWKRLRVALDDLIARNPDSASVAARAADFACRTDDSARYRRDRARFVGQEDDFPLTGGADACDRRHGWPGVTPVEAARGR